MKRQNYLKSKTYQRIAQKATRYQLKILLSRFVRTKESVITEPCTSSVVMNATKGIVATKQSNAEHGKLSVLLKLEIKALDFS